VNAFSQVFYGLLALFVIFELLVEAANASLSNPRTLRALAVREADLAARRVLLMLNRRTQLLAALHLAQLIVRLAIAACVLGLLPVLAEPWMNILQAGAYLLLTSILIFLLEEMVEAMADRHYESWAIRLSGMARLLGFVFTPLVGIAVFLRRNGVEDADQASRVTEDDLKSIVDASHEGGVLEQDEREMIYKIFRLRETLAREVMAPRIYITALDVDNDVESAIQALLDSGFSRAPVYEETIDHVIGLVYARDLLRATQSNDQVRSLRDILRPVYFVPEAKRVDELLDEMQARQVHMAIVVDEYGGVAGLVTLEDIIEEIVGEIRDEYDAAEELRWQQTADNEFVFLGRVDTDDFNYVMGTNLPREEAETLGGFIYSQLGRVPVNGESIQINGLTLTVEQVAGRRIRKVRAVRHLEIPEREKNDKPDE
jgi:CBS domain containing-hemolysin-like protein